MAGQKREEIMLPLMVRLSLMPIHYEWLRTKPNMSEYIRLLIEDDYADKN